MGVHEQFIAQTELKNTKETKVKYFIKISFLDSKMHLTYFNTSDIAMHSDVGRHLMQRFFNKFPQKLF